MTRLLINVNHPREIFERDGLGGWRPPERSTVVTVEVTNSIGEGDDELFFRAGVRVPKSLCVQSNDAQRLAVGFLQAWLPTHLTQSNYLDFYDLKSVDYADTPDTDVAALTQRAEAAVTPTPALTGLMAKATLHNSAVKAQFTAAKKTLTDLAYDNTPYGFQTSVNEARQCFRILEEILDCSAGLGGPSSRDARNALGRYEELARRKVANNHNYQTALTHVQRFAYGVTFPYIWGKRPELRG